MVEPGFELLEDAVPSAARRPSSSGFKSRPARRFGRPSQTPLASLDPERRRRLSAFANAPRSLSPGESTELSRRDTASVEAGATLEMDGRPLDREGAFCLPTVLTDVPEGCPADAKETFGSVAAVYEVEDKAAVVEKANDTPFGLSASVWTEDRECLARRIDARCVYVDQLVTSGPRVPFGGFKKSGYGRELSGPGIQEFVNRKTVQVE